MSKVRLTVSKPSRGIAIRMQYLFGLVVWIMLLTAPVAQAQYILPVDFNDVNMNVFTDFGGANSFNAQDPTDETNFVIETIKRAEAESWAGTTLGAGATASPSFAGILPFTETSTQITMRVWSPIVGATVRMKVEVHGDLTLSAETEAFTTVSGEWETLTFDFATVAEGTSPLNLMLNYNIMSVFFNFGTDGATAGELTFYWDDIAFADGSMLFDPVIEEPVDPVVALTMPIDFEDDLIDWTNVFTDFDGGMASVIANPDVSDANLSGFVGQMVKGAGEVWAGSHFTLSAPLDMTSMSAFLIDVWVPRAESLVMFKLENSQDPNEFIELEQTVGTAGEWVTMMFDFTPYQPSNNLDRVVLIFDRGTMGDGSADFTYYFDNIETTLPPVYERPVTFVVDMSVQFDKGGFRPDMDDVYVRGGFNDFMIDENFLMQLVPETNLLYTVTAPITGYEGYEYGYKFYIFTPEDGADGANSWEASPVGPVGDFGDRSLILGPPDVEQVLDWVYFSNDDGTPPPVEQGAIPFWISADNSLPYVPGQPLEMYLVLGDEENLFYDMLGFGFELMYDRAALHLDAYELLDGFVMGAMEHEILIFMDNSGEFDDFSFSRIAEIGGLTGHGAMVKFYFSVLEGYEHSNVYVLAAGEQVLNTSGDFIPTYVDGMWFDIVQNPVWPGDTNNDGIVDIFDVLPLGQYYQIVGTDRFDRNLQFIPKMGGFFEIMEAMYADANGDGVVSQNDLLPIGLNYGQFVDWKLFTGEEGLKKSNTTPLASIELPEGESGDKHTISIRFNHPNHILGVATEMTMNPALFSATSKVEAVPLTLGGVLRMERKATETMPMHSFAVTRTHQMGAADIEGTVLTFEITYREDVPAGTTLDVSKLAVTTLTGTITPDFELLSSWVTSISTEQMPVVFELNQNYPNPFNPTTAIRFALPEAAAVRLSLYNMLGQQVAVISNGEMNAGWHTVNFNATTLSSGTYIYRLEAGNFVQNRKMTLIK